MTPSRRNMSFHERLKDIALDVGLGRSYGHTGDDSQNCVRFLFAILVALYPSHPVKSYSNELHLNVPDGMGGLHNVEAIEAMGLGTRRKDFTRGGIYYCQGWRKLSNGKMSGHSFMVLVPFAPIDDEPWILDSTNGTTDWYRPVDTEWLLNRYDVAFGIVQLLAA